MLARRLSKKLQDVTYTRIGVSEIHGVGVVAIRPIPAGVNPFGDTTYMEELVPMTEAEVDALGPPIAKLVRDFCLPQEGIYWVMPSGFNKLDVSFYMNHSELNPNVEAVHNGEGTLCNFRSIRPIAEGEELLFNYYKETH